MSQTATDVVEKIQSYNPDNVVAVYSTEGGGIAVSWSDMPIEMLTYLAEVFSQAVSGKVAQGFARAPEPTPDPAPETKKKRTAETRKAIRAVTNF